MASQMRSSRTPFRIAVAVAAAVFSCAPPAVAQANFSVVHTFPGPAPARPYAPLVQGLDGNFYGTTFEGGDNNSGTIFRMTPAGVITIVHQFTHVGLDGSAPRAGLVQANDGTFYGVTTFGGPGDQGMGGSGTVFQMTTAGVVTGLFPFGGPTDGSSYPIPTLFKGNDGNFYGTTFTDGLPVVNGVNTGSGTVYRFTPGSGIFTIHAWDRGPTDGGFAVAGVIQARDGNLYGTTNQGGPADLGTVFKVTVGGTVTLLHTFAGGTTDGQNSWGGVIQGRSPDNNLYGTTVFGGAEGCGTVFRIATDGSGFTILHSFNFTNDGCEVLAGLVQGTDGNFYGTTHAGGTSNNGTVFKMTPTGTMTKLHDFNDANGSHPYASLIQGTDGNFYGTTFYGGANHAGVVFKITSAGVFTLLQSFGGGTDAARPMAPLIVGTDGNLYGTSEIGGIADKGTIYRMSPAGAVTILHSFINYTFVGGGINVHSYSALVQATDGNFYGAANTFDVPTQTVLYKITAGGTFTALHTLSTATEGFNASALIQATDGNFYGTARSGGTSNVGTIFKMTPAGTVTVLHTFLGGSDGDSPYAPLVQGSDGNLYGTTFSGGASNSGLAFKIALTGSGYTVLHSFVASTEGANPQAPLIQALDGNFYGTTQESGASQGGTIFKMTPGGTVTVLHAFDNTATDPLLPFIAAPNGALVQAADGTFYGTHVGDGATTFGMIYSMTPAGVFTVLHTFNGSDGATPYAGLVRASGTSFYGTTYHGGPTYHGLSTIGPTGVGEVFRLSFAAPFTDEPLVPQVTTIKAVHITELRTRIDTARGFYHLPAYQYSESVAAGVSIKSTHIIEMRAALLEAYNAAARTPPTYTTSPAVGVPIVVADIADLRSAVRAIE
jgi:uncharacterized repeat protein (TIGR03803 family)